MVYAKYDFDNTIGIKYNPRLYVFPLTYIYISIMSVCLSVQQLTTTVFIPFSWNFGFETSLTLGGSNLKSFLIGQKKLPIFFFLEFLKGKKWSFGKYHQDAKGKKKKKNTFTEKSVSNPESHAETGSYQFNYLKNRWSTSIRSSSSSCKKNWSTSKTRQNELSIYFQFDPLQPYLFYQCFLCLCNAIYIN